VQKVFIKFMKITTSQLAKIIKGKLVSGDSDSLLRNVVIDSRLVKKGDIFFAIKGNNLDGHAFINKVMGSGAGAVIVSKVVKNPSAVVIQVKDTTQALGLFAAWHRQQFDIPVIAITGSVGKTTTKDYIAATLGGKFNVLSSQKSFNNHIGVPLTLLRLQASHKAAVVELGSNQPGDIAYLAKIVKPTIGVLTNIGASHLEKLKDQAGVAREKLSLLKYVKSTGTVIYNSDDKYLTKLKSKKMSQRRIGFSVNGISHYQALDVKRAKKSISFSCLTKKYTVSGHAIHNIMAALPAIFCGEIFKCRYNTTYTNIKKVKVSSGRGRILKGSNVVIIDDTYNANPLSFASAIESLEKYPTSQGRIVVVGDMLELGAHKKRLHQELGDRLAKSNVSTVICFGDLAQHVAERARKNSKLNVYAYKAMPSLIKKLKLLIRSQDVVLVKGSRTMRMERVVKELI
jgi:UDP-N-acetylmuramoyl-tripeptide--D-alanyl-D-alanine ligase